MKKKIFVGSVFVCSFFLMACGVKENIETRAKVTEAVAVTQETKFTSTPTILPEPTAILFPFYQPFTGNTSEYIYYYEDEKDRKWEEDIIYLANKVLINHPMMTNVEYSIYVGWNRTKDSKISVSGYKEGSREQFLEQINSLVLQISEMDDVEILYELQRIVAMLNDGHTKVHVPAGKYFPVYYTAINQNGEYRLFATVVPKEQEEILFSYLESINGVPTKEIIKSLRSYASADNEYAFLNSLTGTSNVTWLMCENVLQIIGVLEEKADSAEFCFITENGSKQNIVIKLVQKEPEEMVTGCAEKNNGMLMYQNNRNYWYTDIEEKEALYIRMSNYFEDGNNPVQDFAEQLLEEIKETTENTKIIFDFRGNSGGNINLIDYDDIIEVLNQREDIKVFLLIDKGSASSGVLVPYLLKEKITNLLLIGEPAGQDISCYGNPQKYSMPNSKNEIYIANNYIELNKEYVYDALIPDITIYQTLEDYKNGIDTVLEAVLAME